MEMDDEMNRIGFLVIGTEFGAHWIDVCVSLNTKSK